MNKSIVWFQQLVDDVKFLANKVKNIGSSVGKSPKSDTNPSLSQDAEKREGYSFSGDEDFQQQLNIGLVNPVGAEHCVNSMSPFYDGSKTMY
ncbi:hypothetical protein ABXZ88_003252 [Vibrio fluvialis]